MKALPILGVVVSLTTLASTASAQNVRGFVSGGVISDVNHDSFPSVGGGMVVNLGQPWVAAGVQAETFWQWPYFAGRVALFGQGNIVPRGRFRPFVLAGYGFGETAGTLVGGGIEFRPLHHRAGLRISVEDYLVRIRGLDCGSFGLQSYCDANPRAARGYIGHQVAVRAGVTF